jgi:serine/threonine protein kinase/TolA-binding protein
MDQSDKNSIIHQWAEELADNLRLSTDHQSKLNQTEQASLEQLQIISQVAQLHRQHQTSRAKSTDQRSDQKSSGASLFTWGRLSVKAAIGQGAFGEVYRAHDQILDRDVALKLLKDDVQGPLKSQAFIEEAKRMAKVRHPNVLAIHGANIHEGRAGFWADFINGHTLGEAPDFGQMNYEKLFQFARQVASGLQAIHQSGLIHGDIKPGNIIQDPQGRFIIMDFGAGLTVTESQQLSGYLHGTPALMAPELFNNKHSGSPTDIYAFGATLFKLASDRYPVAGRDIMDIQHSHHNKAYENLKRHRPDLPRDFTALVQSMVDHDPNKRPDCQAILSALYDIETAPQRRRNKITLWVIISLLLVGTGLSSWGFFQANKAKNQALLAQEKAESINRFLRETLSAGSQLGGGRDVKILDVLDKAAKEIESNPDITPDVAIEIHQSLADSYNAITASDQALKHADLSLDLAKKHYLPDSLQVTRGRLEKAQALMILGNHKQGIETADHVITDASDKLGNEHWYIQRAHMLKIEGLFTIGQYDKGIAILDQFFDDIPEPESAANNLGFTILQAKANAMSVKGRFKEAIEYAQQAIDWLNAYPKSNLLNKSTITSVLAIAQLQSGEGEAGIMNLKKGLEITEQVNGRHSPTYLGSLINLGSAQRQYGYLKEAQETNQQALSLANAMNTVQAQKRKITLGINMAAILIDLGDYNQAEQSMRETLDLAYDLIGAEHPQTLVLEYNLTESLYKQGKFKEAEEWSISTIEKKKKTFGEDHFYTYMSQDNLAICLSGQKKFNQALDIHQYVVMGMMNKMGENHPHTLLVRQHQIDSLLAADQKQQARELLPQLVTDLTAVHGDDDAMTQQYQSILDNLHR